MDSSNSQLKTNALEIIKNYRVPDLQALLEYARLSRHGQKRELFQRCKILVSSNITPQLANKIHQINLTRLNATKSSMPSSSRTYHNQYTKNHPIVLSTTPPTEILPLPNHIQYVNLPFFDKMRTIECTNMPVDWNTFSPLRFTLTDIDVDYILKGRAKIFLRIAPTVISERQTDVLPPYLFVQCNGQSVINNNISKTVGAQAHSIAFPTDMTDKVIPKVNINNTLNYFWLQSPVNMSFKNLPKSYTLTIQLVRCISLENLFENILKREPQLTTLDNNDSDIEIEDLGLMATRHRVSLICPITQSLMIIPTKSSLCSHLTCFDLRPFLQMNERRLQWTCPLCKKSASYDTLRVDKRLQAILSNVPANCSTVEIDSSTKILSDCQYILDHVKQEKTDMPITTVSYENDDDDEQSIHDYSTKPGHQSIKNDCIVLSSGSESEDETEIDDNNTKSNDSPVPITPLSIDLFNQISDIDERPINHTSQSSESLNSLPSPAASTVDDGSYWEDIARITCDLISDTNEKNLNRKRSNSSTSSLLSDDDGDDDNHHRRRRKRTKRPSPMKSRTGDIEIITLSSSDSSDNDDQLS